MSKRLQEYATSNLFDMAAATAELIIKFVIAPNQSALNREKKKKKKKKRKKRKRKEKKRREKLLSSSVELTLQTAACKEEAQPSATCTGRAWGVWDHASVQCRCCTQRLRPEKKGVVCTVSYSFVFSPWFRPHHCCRSIWTESLAWQLQTWWLQALEKSKFDSPSARKTHRG